MIDISNEVYTFIRKRVKAVEPSVAFSDEYQTAQTVFPCCIFRQADDYIRRDRIDSGNIENAVNVMFEVDVYSNKISGKKEEAKKIMSLVSDNMALIGLVRSMCSPVPNIADATIYRLTARFEGTVDKNNNIFTWR